MTDQTTTTENTAQPEEAKTEQGDQQSQAQQQQPQEPSLTPDDLVAAIMVIDDAAEQGAYKGWEKMQRAMAVRQRLLAFAQHWQKTLEAASKEELAKAAGSMPKAEGPSE